MDLDKAYTRMNIQTAPCCASCISWSPIDTANGECIVLQDLLDEGIDAITKCNNMCECFEGWDEV